MDQFYFEEGYLEASYFTVIREAEAALPVAMIFSAQGDIADATGYYIPDYIAVGYFETGIVEAQGAFSVTASSQIEITRVRTADSAASVSVTQTVIVERITQAAATVTVTVTKSCTVTRIRDSAAAFTAAFAPTLTAIAFKNHTAVLDSVSTMSVDAVANRSANVLLEHIADLNAMAAKTVDVNSNLSHTVSAVITANTNSSAQVTATSTFTLTCAFENLQFATAAFTASTNLFVSRYTNGRPKHLSDINYASLSEYFTTDSKFGSHALQATAPRTAISATGSSAYSVIPQANQDWIFECWYYQVSSHATHGVIGFFVGGGSRFFALDSEDSGRFTLRTFKTGGINTTTTTSISFAPGWLHLAVIYNYGQCGLFVNGARYINQDLSAYTNVAWTGNSIEAQELVYKLGVRGNVRLDEASFHRGSTLGYSYGTAITVPTQRRENDPAYTQFLYHFDNNSFDDIALTQTGTANLSAVSAITAQANANTKLGAASLSTAATLSAQGDRPASATADLSTTSTLSVIIGSVKDSITLNAGVFTVIAQESRLRDAASSITSAFTPTLTAQATRDGDIALSSAFTMSTTATSFTDSGADIASAFAVNCSPTVDFQAAGSLQSQTNINVLGGKLQLFQINVNSALAFTVQAIGFEGTGVGLNTVSTLSVTARRLRTVVSAASSTFTQTTVGNNNPAPFEISDYEIFCSGWTFSAETAFSSNSPGSGQSLINVVIPKVATNPVPQVVGQISLVNGQGTDTIFAPVTYLSRIGTNLYQAYQKERQHAYTTTSQTDNLSTGTFRSTGVSTTNINQSTGAFTISLDYDGPKGTTNATGPIGSPITLRINGNPNYVMLMSSWFNNPPANTSTLRNVSWEPTGQVYSIPYPLGTSADFRNVTSLTAEATEVVIPNPAVFSNQAQIVAIGNALFRGSSNQSSVFATAINAGKNVEIGSALASQSTISVNAVKVTTTSADLNVVGAQNTANDRLRTTTAALATTATVSVDAVKRTGIVLSLNTAATQSVTGFRIQQGQASISALYSQLTVAFQNATGTVLLESVTTMQITAEKNAVGVIALASQFTQSTNSADSKTVRVSSAIAAEFTQSVEGLRIQPAGADVSAQFTQTTNTDQSKITRVNAAFVTTVTTTATAARTRSTPTTLSAATAMVCNNVVLRQGNANLVDNFDLLASPQYIIRITATFSAFNSQLTVGEIINIDPALQLMIEPETRIRKIQQETRVLSIESETRVNIIED